MEENLDFPAHKRVVIDKYLPAGSSATANTESSLPRPHVTLTYAASLDSSVSVTNTQATALSGIASKSMTHYLRARHAAIIVGSGAAIADNPTLNSRLQDDVQVPQQQRQPRPVILDRRARWNVSASSNVLQAARKNRGQAPWIIVQDAASVPTDVKSVVLAHGGEYLQACTFPQVLDILASKGIASVMVEGGATLIRQLLDHHLHLIDTVILTIAPVYLGAGSVNVTPSRGDTTANLPVIAMQDVQWSPLGRDVVMCGRPSAVTNG